jgi:hypothetical protein
MIGGHPLYVI